MKTFSLLISLFALSACLKVTDVPIEEEENLQIQAPQVVALPQPNRYQVILPVGGDIQAVHRSLAQDETQTLVAVPMKLSDSRLTDDQVEAGKTYIYTAGYQKDGEFEEVQSFKVTIPLDQLIDGKVELAADETWDRYSRIFLTKNAVITTNGFTFLLKAKELHSESGTIQTFPQDTKAATLQNGRSGGHIKIDVESAQGVLIAELRGQHGGDGAKGEPLGFWTELYAALAPAPNGTLVGPPIPSHGRKGNPGGAGGNGGHTGRLQMTIQKANEFSLLPTFRPGTGGAGGEGGAGDQPFNGISFTPGPPGDRGANGAPGSIESACLQTPAGRNCWLQ